MTPRKFLAFLPLLALAGCASTPQTPVSQSDGKTPQTLSNLTQSASASDSCTLSSPAWMLPLSEGEDAYGVYKGATWTTTVPVEGGCQLVGETTIRFYRDAVAMTPTGDEIQGMKRARAWFSVKSAAKVRHTQSFRAFAANAGLFSIVDQWDIDSGTSRCEMDYGHYEDGLYDALAAVCRSPCACARR